MRKHLLIAASVLFLAMTVAQLLQAGMAFGNGVVLTEPEGSKPAPPKKAPVVKKTAPAPRKPPEPEPVKAELPRRNIALEEGLKLLEQRFFTRALVLLERAVLEDPCSADAWYALGRACQEKGLFIKARSAYRRTLEIAPDYGPLSRVLAYPSNDGRMPLWDPKRPPRIEDIPVVTGIPSENKAACTPTAGTPAPLMARPQTEAAPAHNTQAVIQTAPGNGVKLRPFVPVRIVKPGEGQDSLKNPAGKPAAAPAPDSDPKDAADPVYTCLPDRFVP